MPRPVAAILRLAVVIAFGAVSPATTVPAAAVASDWARNPQSQVRLVSGELVAARRGELRLGLQFRLAPGWHVYWKNSGDAGFAPILALEAAGLTGSRLLWPAPHRFELPGDLEAFGYAGEVVYPVRAILTAAGPGPLRVSADIDYLTCRIDCVPYRYTLSLLQPLGERAQPDAQLAPLLQHWWDQLPVPAARLPGVSTRGSFDTSHPEAPALEISVQGLRPVAGAPDLFLEPNDELSTGRPEVRETAGGLVFRLPVKPKVAGRPLPARTTFAWTVTGLERAGAPIAIESQGTVTFAAASGGTAKPGRHRESVAPPGPAVPAGAPFGLGPVPAALLASLALAAALLSWGLLARSGDSRGPIPAALGFVALAAVLLPLYVLALQVRPEGLAGIELLLLGMALLAWLRRRAGSRRGLRFALLLGVVVCAAALLWLADHSRLEPTVTRRRAHAQRPSR